MRCLRDTRDSALRPSSRIGLAVGVGILTTAATAIVLRAGLLRTHSCAVPAVPLDLASTDKREIRFERLVSSAPFPKLLTMTSEPFDASIFSYNKVLVFNLGFDSKGQKDVHWVYFPDKATS